jgi:hypothetical protein
MAESPQRFLEAIARALGEDVAPHVSDRFAQMQCKAAAELIGNLAQELAWAPEPFARREAELDALLDRLRQAGWNGGDQSHPAPLDELAAALRWLAHQPASAQAAIDAHLMAELDRQVAALRRGMFR